MKFQNSEHCLPVHIFNFIIIIIMIRSKGDHKITYPTQIIELLNTYNRDKKKKKKKGISKNLKDK